MEFIDINFTDIGPKIRVSPMFFILNLTGLCAEKCFDPFFLMSSKKFFTPK